MGNTKSKTISSGSGQQIAIIEQQENSNSTAQPTFATEAISTSRSVYRRQDQLFNILKHIAIELDGNIITDDIWRIVADFATGKLIECKSCKVHFCVISEDQIYLNLDYEANKHKEDVYFQTSAAPFAEVIYCKPCYEQKYVLETEEERVYRPPSRVTTYSGPMY